MKILDKEIEFDFFDAEQMEKYEKEFLYWMLYGTAKRSA